MKMMSWDSRLKAQKKWSIRGKSWIFISSRKDPKGRNILNLNHYHFKPSKDSWMSFISILKNFTSFLNKISFYRPRSWSKAHQYKFYKNIKQQLHCKITKWCCFLERFIESGQQKAQRQVTNFFHFWSSPQRVVRKKNKGENPGILLGI